MTCGDKSDWTVKNNLRGNQQYYQDTTKAYHWQREWWGDLKRQKKKQKTDLSSFGKSQKGVSTELRQIAMTMDQSKNKKEIQEVNMMVV